MICRECQRDFKPANPRQKVCSSDCRRARAQRAKRAYLQKVTCQERTCQRCGQPFLSSTGTARFCSVACTGTHGESKTRLYQIWCDMKGRCFRPSMGYYEYYGGRGISVCEEWRNSYEAFRDWALANGYDADMEIDRRDTNGNYDPGNCRWATRTQQMRNTRKRRNAKTSVFKGVSRHSQNSRWIAQICAGGGRPSYIGSFDSEIDAARAYDAAAKELFGEFARTNF